MDKEKGEEIVLLTNHLDFGATTISDAYKDRWQIEIFFKILKQNLRVKTFVGTSANALKIQIWTAVILDTTVAASLSPSAWPWRTAWRLAISKAAGMPFPDTSAMADPESSVRHIEKIEVIAADLLAREADPGNFESRNPRHFMGQKPFLNFTRDLKFPLQVFPF